MAMQYVWYGKFKDGKIEPWIKWWRNEEKVNKFKNLLTEGAKLLGVYVTINQTASHDFEIWYEMDNWAVLDKSLENQAMAEFQKEIFEEYGEQFEWVRTKVLKTVHEVKSAIYDI